MKNVIIFGATGNVGSFVTIYAQKYFNPQEYHIIASGRRQTNVFTRMGIEYIPCDITDPKGFDYLPVDNVYAVILLAAQIPSYMKEYQPQKYVQTNIVGTFNVLEYCRRVHADRLLFSTTVFDISLYAKQSNIVLKPDLPLSFSYKGDHAVYVICKNTALEMMEHYYEEYGLKKFIFRFPTIYAYSPYHYYYPNGVKTMRPVYHMIDQAIKGEPVELWGNPQYSKDMVYVDDCAQMLCKAVEAPLDTGFYNVGTGVPVTMQEQIETIINVFTPPQAKRRSEILYRPDKPIGGGS